MLRRRLTCIPRGNLKTEFGLNDLALLVKFYTYVEIMKQLTKIVIK